MTQDQQPQTGWQRFRAEAGAELKRMGRLGAYEMGAALQAFPPGENIYRGDLGMLSTAQGTAPRIQPPEQGQHHVQTP